LEVYDRYVIIWLFSYHTLYQPETSILVTELYFWLPLETHRDRDRDNTIVLLYRLQSATFSKSTKKFLTYRVSVILHARYQTWSMVRLWEYKLVRQSIMMIYMYFEISLTCPNVYDVVLFILVIVRRYQTWSMVRLYVLQPDNAPIWSKSVIITRHVP
jgi:hypothetical protein